MVRTVVHRAAVTCGVMTLGLIVAACGSSGSSGAGSASSGAGSASSNSLQGAPVRIGLIASEQDPSISVPDVHRAAEIAVKDVNAHGGIKGRPLQLDFCDDQDNAQTEAQCAHTLLVTDNDLMLVGEAAGPGGTTLYPVLQQTHKINFADYPVLEPDVTNPLSYPIVPATFQLTTGLSVIPSGSGTFVVLTNSGYQSFIQALVGPGLAKRGYKLDIIAEPQSTVDWTTAAAQANQDNAKYVMLATAQDKSAAIVNALQQSGTKATVVITSTSVTAEALKLLAGAHTPSIIAAATSSDPSASPLYKQYQADLRQYGSEVGIQDTVGQQVVNAYAGVILFAQTANKLSTVDSASFQKYLDAQTSFSTEGLTHPIDFAKPGALTGFPRLFNTWNLPATATADGSYKTTSTTWLAP
jgi:ABC-type branched-subunit amino acid transport system substrate-binding protein